MSGIDECEVKGSNAPAPKSTLLSWSSPKSMSLPDMTLLKSSSESMGLSEPNV